MKAAVIEKAGPPSVLKIKDIPVPQVTYGNILIRIKAFGLNHAEVVTRKGGSPSVKFPRVIGIECVGEVEEDPSGEFEKGQKIAAMVGGMGRQFDGSYEEFASVPKSNVFPFSSNMDWAKLGAIPEMYLTVSGSLRFGLDIKKGEILLIRGGSSSIGLNACQFAKFMGLKVISTTRNPDKEQYLKDNGADYVVIDDGSIYEKVRKLYPAGVDKVLELVGPAVIKDSLKCVKPLGILCMTGALADIWSVKDFSPLGDIPPLVRLTGYGSNPALLSKEEFQTYIDNVEDGKIKLITDKVFHLDEIVRAHEYLESNEAKGKVVVFTGGKG